MTDNHKPSVMFMGTPEFAAAQLAALYEGGYEIKAVVTQTDKPKGRGHRLAPPPVKEYALEKGLAVIQPATLKSEEFAQFLRETDPEIIIVAAYGKLLPENVISYPRFGCVNVHGSLLPKYRGAAPIQRAVMNGETLTGVTTMLMDKGLDTGDMLMKAEVPILPCDDAGTLTSKMARAGAKLLLETIEKLVSGGITPEKQDSALSTYAAKIEKPDCAVDFKRPAADILNQIRALSPEPMAASTINGKPLKIASAALSDLRSDAPAGTVAAVDGGITVSCGEGCVTIKELIPAGKNRMTAAAFVNGRQCSVGDKFGD